MSNIPRKQSARVIRIHNFFEQPAGFWAKLTQVVIFLLIIVSVTLVVIEVFYSDIFERHKLLIEILGYVALVVFTIEYLLRFFTAPRKLKFAIRPMNIVDFLAVFPTYIEIFMSLAVNTSAIRGLRLIRLMRFARALRALKVFKYGKMFKKVFSYNETVLQSIMPVISMFMGLKIVVLILEHYGYWFDGADLGELFAMVGFALGIILSQKIGASYGKFLQVEEAAIRLYATLDSLTLILNRIKPNLGSAAARNWARAFLALLEDAHADNQRIRPVNLELYRAIAEAEEVPAELAILHGDICRDAALCLSKKVRLTPKAYDVLLHQATMVYLFLIVVFIPGLSGLISTLIATYILYGMYNLTQDIDSIIGGEFSLINIDISELKELAGEELGG